MKWEDEKRDAWHMVLFIFFIWMIFFVADLVSPDKSVSQLEERSLAQKPEITGAGMADGSYFRMYEEYLEDQFVNRDKFISIRLKVDSLLHKKEVNGLYVKDKSNLFLKLLPEKYEPLEDEALQKLSMWIEKYPQLKVALIPTKESVLSEKLPLFAPNYNQKAFLDKAKAIAGESQWLDVYSVLSSHEKEKVFLKGDTHLSMLGSMYIYEAWMESRGGYPRYYDPEDMETVLTSFRGNLCVPQVEEVTDQIMVFPQIQERQVSVVHDHKPGESSLFSGEMLESDYPYDYYLGGEHGFTKITTGYRAGQRELIILKDSFANPMIGFFVPYYSKIYVIDLTVCGFEPEQFIDGQMTDKTEILLLESVIGFLDK